MSLIGKIGRGVAAFSIETVLSNLFQVFAVALVFRYLTPETYGQLALALTFHATGTIFLDFGLGPVFTAEIAKGRGEGSPERLKLYVWRYLCLEMVTGSALFIAYALIGLKQAGVFRILWPLMGFYILGTGLSNVAVTIFHSHTLYGYQAGQSIFRSAVRLLLLATFRLWWYGDALIGVALTFGLMELLTGLMSLAIAGKIVAPLRSVPLPTSSWPILWQMLKEQGLYSSLIIPVRRVQDQMPVWLITVLAGNAAAGAFAMAQGGFAIIFSFFRGVETALFPLVSERLSTDQRLLHDTMQQTTKYSFWFGLLALVGGWLFAPLFVRVIAGEAYAEAVPVFRVMLFYTLVYAFAQIQRPLFYAARQQRALFISYLVNIVEYAVLLVMGTLILGATGAALSWVVSEGLIVCFRQWQLARRDPQLAFKPGTLFVINEYDRQLWLRFVQLVRHARLIR